VIRVRFVTSMFVAMRAMLVVVMFIACIMFVIMLRDSYVLWDIMVMEAEEAFDKEHQQEACNHPEHGLLTGRCFKGMCEHVQQADPEHHATDEADGKLHPAMRQLHEQGDEPAKQ
jgi:hypothetical protein